VVPCDDYSSTEGRLGGKTSLLECASMSGDRGKLVSGCQPIR
jgi:hypothetical protein